ncbi:hypothetical protein BJ170DRAFT_632151 [Xylariales sp. AK1849]|nr:hypothetical protein BJ170DRAFT_632151 [Xylariales sp. AK1849]
MTEQCSQPSWAAPDDWAGQRKHITDLYIAHNHPLRVVMQRMREDHGFKSTMKVYKTHLKKRGIQKNIRSKQVSELFRERQHVDDVASELSIQGNKNERLGKYLKRVSKERRGLIMTAATDHPATSGNILFRVSRPSPSPSRILLSDYDRPEELMHTLRDYVSGAFDSGLWTRDCIPWHTQQVTLLHNYAWSAGRLINSGHVQQCFRLLGFCMDQCEDLITSGTPFFPTDMYLLLMEFSKRNHAVAKSIIAFLRELSLVVHRSRFHPVYVLFARMHQMSSEELIQSAWALVMVYLGSLETALGPDSPFAEQFTSEYGFAISWIAAYGVVEEHTAERTLQELIDKLHTKDPTSFATMEAKLRLTNLLFDRGRYREACVMATEILDTGGLDANAYIIDDCYRILFWIWRIDGVREEAVKAAERWVTFCTTKLGHAHELTVDALNEVESYLETIGDSEAARKVRQDHVTAMTEMCERLESIALETDDQAAPVMIKLYGRMSQFEDLVVQLAKGRVDI